MKVIFTLGSANIGGGTNVILEHASKMKALGEDVYIVTDKKVKPSEYKWHSKAHTLKWVTYKEIKNEEFDIAIATWWRTVYNLHLINAKKYLYFVQSIESRFYEDNEVGLKMLADMTYLFDLRIITEATWIKKYLEKNYKADVKLVKNGIRKDIYTNIGSTYPKCDGLRVLVEGPVDVEFKNVPKTIELARRSNAKEVWLLTSSDIKEYKGVDKVFSRIPPEKCAKIYRSCDVIVKLSFVEGMFGPPLEMFHCGGTTIVYNVTGYDEYIKNNYNGIVVKMGEEDKVVEAIDCLTNQETLSKLKTNALKTAKKWIDWDMSSTEFYEAVKELNEKSSPTKDSIEIKSRWYMDIYSKYENKSTSLRRKIGNIGREKLPGLYKIYRDIIGK